MLVTLRLHSIPGRPAYGADGLVRAIVGAGAEVSGALTLSRARVLSGVAFRAYQLTPDDNYAYREAISEREWAWGATVVENYGVVESLGAHMDRDLRWYTGLAPPDLIALTRHELSAGRVVLVRLSGPRSEYALMSAMTTPAAHLEVAAPPAYGAAFELNFDASEGPRAAEGLLASVLVMRPRSEPCPTPRASALEQDVLRYAIRHSRAGRELSFEEELYYASGVRALTISAEHLVDRWRLDHPAPEFAAYWQVWAEDFYEARQAASIELRPNHPAAATAYAEVAELASELRGDREWADLAARTEQARVLAALREREEKAVAALEASLQAGP